MYKFKYNFLVLFLLISMMINCGSSLTTYYVRMDGSDTNSGLKNSSEHAFQSLNHALKYLKPGNRLLVEDGEYVGNTVRIENLHGTCEAPIIIKAVNPWGAILTRPENADPDSSVVVISNSSYVVFEGFHVFDSMTGIESGVDVRNHSHHITVKGNYVHDCACGGISSRKSDYLVFDGNVVRANAKRNKWNCSGISVWHPIEQDQEPGFHIVIRNNVAFENECEIPFTPLGHTVPTDGNGIIVDDYRGTQQIEGALGQTGGFASGTLIENNLCFNNGGKGINVYKSDNVTIRNNTSYHNMRILHKYSDFGGDVTVGNANGLRFYNNIIVQHPDYTTSAIRCYDNDSSNTKIYNNIIVGNTEYSGQELFDENNQKRPADDQKYPQFINPKIDVEFESVSDFQNYFGLKKTSPFHTQRKR